MAGNILSPFDDAQCPNESNSNFNLLLAFLIIVLTVLLRRRNRAASDSLQRAQRGVPAAPVTIAPEDELPAPRAVIEELEARLLEMLPPGTPKTEASLAKFVKGMSTEDRQRMLEEAQRKTESTKKSVATSVHKEVKAEVTAAEFNPKTETMFRGIFAERPAAPAAGVKLPPETELAPRS